MSTDVRSLGRPTLFALLAAGAGVALLTALYGNYEVVEKGQLLDYTSGTIYRIRFFGRFTVFVEPESRLTPDAVNAFLLTGIGFVSLTFATLLLRFRTWDAVRACRFFALLGAGAIYLAADEFLGIHETLGHNLPFLAALPLVHRPDDAIIALYGLAALGFFAAFRDVLLAWPKVRLFAGAALALGLIAVISDTLAWPIEEVVEVGVALCVISAALWLGADLVSAASTGSVPGGGLDRGEPRTPGEEAQEAEIPRPRP